MENFNFFREGSSCLAIGAVAKLAVLLVMSRILSKYFWRVFHNNIDL